MGILFMRGEKNDRRQPFSHDTTSAAAATNMAAVVTQPRTLRARPLTRLPMIARLLAMSMITTSKGGDRKPLITDDQISALTGWMPSRSMATAPAVEAAITR